MVSGTQTAETASGLISLSPTRHQVAEDKANSSELTQLNPVLAPQPSTLRKPDSTSPRNQFWVRNVLLLGVIGFFVGGAISQFRDVLFQPIAPSDPTVSSTGSEQTISEATSTLSPEAALPPEPAESASDVEAPVRTDSEAAAPILPEAREDSDLSVQRLRPITQETGLGAVATLLSLPKPPTVAVTLKAVGDIIPGTNFPNYRLPKDPNYLFNSVQPFLEETDLLFGNFESTLTDYPYSAKDISRGMTFAFRTPPAFAGVLQAAGFDVLSVANNHSFDFAEAGFNDTIAAIEQAGMQAVGRKGQIVTVQASEYAIAFIGFSYLEDHNSMHDLDTARSLIQAAQEQADIVVVSVHAGAEGTDALATRNRTEYFFSENRGNLVQFSRAMVDAGADVILGHGPHVPRALEIHQEKLIVYSLGNFLGYRTLSTVGPLGKSMILQIELDATGNFLSGRIIPVALDPNGVPYIDNFFESVTLVRQLTIQDFPNTSLEIDEMGYILRVNQ
ncbi:MAG: CapA family protein [Leptolyngbya sp. SIO1D8]|nr:CapA family protein [Leptolyngbya sp. SIO1D8]